MLQWMCWTAWRKNNKMITVKLRKEEYNRLRGGDVGVWRDEQDGLILLEQKDNKICFISCDCDEEIELAKIDLDTPEGGVFVKYIGCLIKTHSNSDGKSLFVTRECFLCMDEIGCENCLYDYEELEQIVFIDPILYRDEHIYLEIEKWKTTIEHLRKEKSLCNEYEKVKVINQTVNCLEAQLQNLLDEWNYKEE